MYAICRYKGETNKEVVTIGTADVVSVDEDLGYGSPADNLTESILNVPAIICENT